MTTLPRFDSINLGDSPVPADAQEQFARLAAAAGEQEPGPLRSKFRLVTSTPRTSTVTWTG
ncbi:methylmalonyl-CoA mutase [Cutibacterium acnes JCM 18918]|nr:methylmalonyl-CoA mutase [Cutibacterium acnes JCM 18918]